MVQITIIAIVIVGIIEYLHSKKVEKTGNKINLLNKHSTMIERAKNLKKQNIWN